VDQSGAPSSRQQAEHAYANAYDQIAKAKEDLAKGKDKNAQKKFKHALESAQEAVQYDPQYYEAWNAVGYASRKLGDYDGAVKAYNRALEIKPDYAAAREYLGEAYVEMGQIAEAQKQLVMLDHQSATEESKQLKASIDAYLSAHPDSSAQKAAGGSGN
jgi:tetratricopeptide (TPR) repeat protein